MKIIILCLILLFATVGFAQDDFEKKAIEFDAQYDKAVLDNDLAFMERHLAENFISIGPGGATKNKEQSIQDIKQSDTSDDFLLLNLSSERLQIQISGNLAVITSKWAVGRLDKKSKFPSPATETGYSTIVYKFVDNDWKIMSEQIVFGEVKSNNVVQEVGETGNKLARALQTNNAEELKSILSQGYVVTDEHGVKSDYAETIKNVLTAEETYTNYKFNDRFIRYIRGTAIETGTIFAEGRLTEKPFTINRSYTRCWVFIDGKWRVFSEHFSAADKALIK